jgi:hypothetical protein
MLTIERLKAQLAASIPRGRFGLIALLADPHAGHHGSSSGHELHVLVFVGMVIVLAIVVAYGARRHHGRGSARPNIGGLDRNAPR